MNMCYKFCKFKYVIKISDKKTKRRQYRPTISTRFVMANTAHHTHIDIVIIRVFISI